MLLDYTCWCTDVCTSNLFIYCMYCHVTHELLVRVQQWQHICKSHHATVHVYFSDCHRVEQLQLLYLFVCLYCKSHRSEQDRSSPLSTFSNTLPLMKRARSHLKETETSVVSSAREMSVVLNLCAGLPLSQGGFNHSLLIQAVVLLIPDT